MNDILSSLGFQVSLLLLVAVAGCVLAARLRQSAIVAEIIIGCLIGPCLLGWITYNGLVESLAGLGAIVLLFVIGLDFKISDVYTWRYGLVALGGVVLPWIGGFFTASLFGYSFQSSVFVGTALTATSIAITVGVLKELKKLDTPAAKMIIGAAVIDDILGLLFLSMSQDIVLGTLSPAHVMLVIFKVLAFLIGGTLLGQYVLKKLVERMDNSLLAEKYPESVFIFAMLVCFIYSTLSELVGLSAIVGAFIAGIALGGIDLKHCKSYTEGAEYLRIIFGAIFFVSLGILVDVRIVTPDILVFLAVLVFVAIAAKFVGCSGTAKLLGMSGKDSLITGIGMVPRGEVAMIVALLGLQGGVINSDIYTVIVLMSLLTTVVTPFVLTGLLSRQRT